jgi:glycosyltransferase involved in cell wall biosynthesis
MNRAMGHTPRVTALIDTYNHERFLAEAIESVLAQDFPAREMEILVVDDGSTDATPQVAARYADRIRYIRKENGGQASAFNVGFSEARGEFIALLDADDVWLPQKIRRVVEEFDRHPQAGAVFHPGQYWCPDEGRCEPDTSFVPLDGYLPDSEGAILRFSGLSTSWTTLRREVARRILPLPEKLKVFADSYIIATVIFCAPVATVNEGLARYRLHGANLTFSIEPDPVRAKRSNDSFRCAIEETRCWFEKNGFLGRGRAAELQLERMELIEELQRFVLRAPGRLEFFRHLRRYHRLYSPLWSGAYRLFDNLKAGAGFLFGYQSFFAAQRFYRRSPSLPRLRESVVPALRRDCNLPAGAGRPGTLELR